MGDTCNYNSERNLVTPGDFTHSASAVLTLLSAAVPFPMLTVSRRRGDDYVVLASYDRQYGLVQGDVLPWSSTLCARVLDGSAPSATGDTSTVPALVQAAEGLRLDVGAYLSVPMLGPGGELLGTVCAADPQRREGELREELEHVRLAAEVLQQLLAQQLEVDKATRHSEVWEQAASSDPLTGLGSRRLWEDRLPHVEQRCAALGSSAAVIVLDLDGLKHMNDLLGHAAGDALLRSAGDVLRDQLQGAHLLARTGGDEFAAVLVDVDEASVRATSELVRAALADVDVEVSVGVHVRSPQVALEEAWHLADSAMYADKVARASGVAAGTAPARSGHRSGRVSQAADAVRQEHVSELLREVREILDLPVAFVSRFTGGQRVIEAVASDCPVPLQPGDSHEEEVTYCRAIVDEHLPQAIPDAAAHPFTAGLPITRELGIGSYVGVPILTSGGALYGTLCAYAHEARAVDERDTALLQLVARTIGLQLSEGEGSEEAVARARIRRVLEDDLLTVAYQPVVDIATGTTASVEALARFPEQFGRRPDQWFSDAVEVGQSQALETAAADKAVAGLRRLPKHIPVAVNVSAAVAVSAPFIDWLMSKPLHRIVLELTEHEQVEDYAALNAALQPARDAGMRLAVDDAGAGYASMRHWLMLRPDLLKLDRSLVQGVDGDSTKRALCQAVITFAHSTGARVVAEGVETAAEYEAVRALGADFAQGYLLQRPVPLSDLLLAAVTGATPAAASPEVVLRTIREMTHVGCSPTTIAARLNQLGARRPNGVRWHRTSVTAALVDGQPAR